MHGMNDTNANVRFRRKAVVIYPRLTWSPHHSIGPHQALETNMIATTIDCAVPRMPGPKWVDVNGARTCYYEAGSGEPVLFIYGGSAGVAESAECAGTWNLNLLPLAARFRAIAYDKLGQGYTDNPSRDEDYTIGAVVQHAAGFITGLGLPPVHVVGHSRGGYAATRLTLERPDLIQSLTIVNSSTLSPGVGTNEVVLAGCPYAPYSRESARWIYEHYCFSKASVTDEWVNMVTAIMQQDKYRESVRKMVGEFLGSKIFLPHLARQKRETLERIANGYLQRPTQIFWGQDDATALIERGLELFHMIAQHDSRAVFHAINRSGHFPFREQAQRFNALLISSLDAIAQTGRS
jgi:2-hydroxy-6-oxonona-2,4-dienedioate hydrolase